MKCLLRLKCFMRADKLYLVDIIQAAEDIGRLISGMETETFVQTMSARRATLQAIIEIGEATAKVSPELKGKYPEVRWQDAIAMRNIAVHEYFSVDWRIVWDTAIHDIPHLKQQIQRILNIEFPTENNTKL